MSCTVACLPPRGGHVLRNRRNRQQGLEAEEGVVGDLQEALGCPCHSSFPGPSTFKSLSWPREIEVALKALEDLLGGSFPFRPRNGIQPLGTMGGGILKRPASLPALQSTLT